MAPAPNPDEVIYSELSISSAEAMARRRMTARQQPAPQAQEESHYASIDHWATEQAAREAAAKDSADAAAGSPLYSNLGPPTEATYANVDANGMPLGDRTVSVSSGASVATNAVAAFHDQAAVHIFPNLPTLVRHRTAR